MAIYHLHYLSCLRSHHQPLPSAMGRDIISLDDVTPNNLGVLKKINEAVLPTTYPEAWYQDSLNSSHIIKLAYFSELPVGAIRSKAIVSQPQLYDSLVASSSIKDAVPLAVYIELLAVLPAYQHQGIGLKLLQYLEEQTKEKFIHKIVLHVHVDNKDAQKWYESRGFVKGDVAADYYKEQGLDNPDAYIYTKEV